ncbi:MAG: hypothetical protein E7263_01460 [Lachnospiraceae bacterium]|nr:hypothetical protein [Lachnospiraceae bacterium]
MYINCKSEAKNKNVLKFHSKGRILNTIVIVFCLLFLCGCSNEESKDRPSERKLKKEIEKQALEYKIDGQSYIFELKNFEVVKGQLNSGGHYDAFCKIELEGQYIDVTSYYVLNCAYYDKAGWEIESSYMYSDEEIVINEVPENRISEYVNAYMTFDSDETTYDNNSICYKYNYKKDTTYYTETGVYGVEGYIYSTNGDLFNREFSCSLRLNEYERYLSVNYEALSGVWMASGLSGKDYYIVVNSGKVDSIDWNIERTTESSTRTIDFYLMHEYNSGTSYITEEETLLTNEISFPLSVGASSYYDEVSGITYDNTVEEMVCYFNLDNIEDSSLKYAGAYLSKGYDLVKLDSYPVFEEVDVENDVTNENNNNSDTNVSDNLSTGNIVFPEWYEVDKLVIKGNEACSCGPEIPWENGISTPMIVYYLFGDNGYLETIYEFYVFDTEEDAKAQWDEYDRLGYSQHFVCDKNLLIKIHYDEEISYEFGLYYSINDLERQYEEADYGWEIVYK